MLQPKYRATARFSGDDLSHWAWTEPSVWTNPMLATLEHNRVRGGKWQSLIDKVYKRENLDSAYRKVAANKGAPGVDHVTIEDFRETLTRESGKARNTAAKRNIPSAGHQACSYSQARHERHSTVGNPDDP